MNEEVINGLGEGQVTEGQVASLFDAMDAQLSVNGDLGVVKRTIRQVKPAVQALVNKIKQVRNHRVVETDNLTWKALAENYIFGFTKDAAERLLNKDLKMVEHCVYVTKCVELQSRVKMLTTSDYKKTGISNLNASKLESSQSMIITHIALLSATSSLTPGNDDLAGQSAAFAAPADFVKNGEITMRVGTTTILDGVSASVFNSSANERPGVYRLGKPIIIEPQTEVQFEIDFGTAAPAKSFVKLLFFGGITAKN